MHQSGIYHQFHSLHYTHISFFYSDIKPDNVLLDTFSSDEIDEPKNLRVQIADFNLAQMIEDEIRNGGFPSSLYHYSVTPFLIISPERRFI